MSKETRQKQRGGEGQSLPGAYAVEPGIPLSREEARGSAEGSVPTRNAKADLSASMPVGKVPAARQRWTQSRSVDTKTSIEQKGKSGVGGKGGQSEHQPAGDGAPGAYAVDPAPPVTNLEARHTWDGQAALSGPAQNAKGDAHIPVPAGRQRWTQRKTNEIKGSIDKKDKSGMSGEGQGAPGAYSVNLAVPSTSLQAHRTWDGQTTLSAPAQNAKSAHGTNVPAGRQRWTERKKETIGSTEKQKNDKKSREGGSAERSAPGAYAVNPASQQGRGSVDDPLSSSGNDAKNDPSAHMPRGKVPAARQRWVLRKSSQDDSDARTLQEEERIRMNHELEREDDPAAVSSSAKDAKALHMLAGKVPAARQRWTLRTSAQNDADLRAQEQKEKLGAKQDGQKEHQPQDDGSEAEEKRPPGAYSVIPGSPGTSMNPIFSVRDFQSTRTLSNPPIDTETSSRSMSGGANWDASDRVETGGPRYPSELVETGDSEFPMVEPVDASKEQQRIKRWKIYAAILALLFAVGLGAGIGIGLQARSSSSSSSSSPTEPGPSPPPDASCSVLEVNQMCREQQDRGMINAKVRTCPPNRRIPSSSIPRVGGHLQHLLVCGRCHAN